MADPGRRGTEDGGEQPFGGADGEKIAALKGYRAFMERSGAPLSKRALALTLQKLERLSLGDEKEQARMLEKSVRRGWRGVYPLRPDSGGR